MAVKKVIVDRANRLHQLPPEIMSFVPGPGRRLRTRKTPLIDLGTFQWPVRHDADPERSLDLNPATDEQLRRLREALAGWMESVHGVRLNPDKEVFVGGRISQLVMGLALAFVDNGDIAFVPEVGIPLYREAIAACGGQPVGYEVAQKDDWQPNFERVSSRLGQVARLLFLNSPHNPTGAVLNDRDMANLIWVAGRENIVVVNDAAYQTLKGRPSHSLLASQGGKKVGVEIGSLAYHFGLPQWPAGFAMGNREVIRGLEEVSRLVPSVLPAFFAELAVHAIQQFPVQAHKDVRARLDENSGQAAKLLKLLELERVGYDAVPFIWARIAHRRRSTVAANLLYRRSRVLVAPGKGFGDAAEGYLRFSLTVESSAYEEATERVTKKLRFLKFSEAE